MPSITVSNLAWTKPDGDVVFADLNLSFYGTERVGIVGRNGVGKSTLLEIIAGYRQPSAGNVTIDGTIAAAKQSLSFGSCDTIGDVFGASHTLSILRLAEEGMANADELAEVDWTLEERIVSTLWRFGLDASLETPVSSLSGGQQARVNLAALVFANPDFLLLDEPTNNLDRAGRDAVVNLLRTWDGGAITVSHDRELLSHMDVVIELTSLGASRYGGNWDAYQARKSIELEVAQHDLAHAEKTVSAINRKAQVAAERQERRDAAGARKGARGDLPRILVGSRKNDASASSGVKVNQVSKNRTEATDAAAAARAKIEILQRLQIDVPSSGLPAGRTVLAINNVSVSYGDARPTIQDLSFSMVGPERVAVVGPNGSGKTTLLKLIVGELPPSQGSVAVNVQLAMLDQSVNILDLRASILDNFLRLNPLSSENACRASLARFLFRADTSKQLTGSLSGGQLLRAGLACVVGGSQPPPLLILDEPTNHLDIESIEAIESGLSAYDGALIVVSHDEVFLENIRISRRVELR